MSVEGAPNFQVSRSAPIRFCRLSRELRRQVPRVYPGSVGQLQVLHQQRIAGRKAVSGFAGYVFFSCVRQETAPVTIYVRRRVFAGGYGVSDWIERTKKKPPFWRVP